MVKKSTKNIIMKYKLNNKLLANLICDLLRFELQFLQLAARNFGRRRRRRHPILGCRHFAAVCVTKGSGDKDILLNFLFSRSDVHPSRKWMGNLQPETNKNITVRQESLIFQINVYVNAFLSISTIYNLISYPITSRKK